MRDASAEVRIAFASRTDARTALRALAPDNAGHVKASIDGTTLVLRASATTALGLVRTLDDALACLRAIDIP